MLFIRVNDRAVFLLTGGVVFVEITIKLFYMFRQGTILITTIRHKNTIKSVKEYVATSAGLRLHGILKIVCHGTRLIPTNISSERNSRIFVEKRRYSDVIGKIEEAN
jgi:hypothetical protein